jgi:hypothetical protein
MSCNRENVTWQSKDGTWSNGHFDFYNVNEYDEDFDYEWDVEYEFDRFHWVSTGHATPEAAENAWRGSNPGQFIRYERKRGNCKACDRYDRMADAMKKRAAKQAAKDRGRRGDWGLNYGY